MQPDPERDPAHETSPVPERGRPGRRRDPSVDTAVRAAVIELLAERGWDGVSMDGVAARARVGKASIYRRWPSRVQMVADTMRELNRAELETPDTGSLRGDLLVVLAAMASSLRGPLGTASQALVGVLPHEPELAVAFREGSVGVWAGVLGAVLGAAVDRGEADPVRLSTVASEAGPAVLMQRWLLTGQPLDDALVAEVVDVVVLPLVSAR